MIMGVHAIGAFPSPCRLVSSTVTPDPTDLSLRLVLPARRGRCLLIHPLDRPLDHFLQGTRRTLPDPLSISSPEVPVFPGIGLGVERGATTVQGVDVGLTFLFVI